MYLLHGQLPNCPSATFEDTMNPHLEASIPLIIASDDDPWTTLACRNEPLSGDRLSQASSSATTSVGSSPTAVFSSREPSIVTKPTSYGTSYPAHGYNKQGKADSTYAASLSATRGSGSEAEVELDDALHTTLLGTGAWLSSPQAQGQVLRRREHARIRLSEVLHLRHKKPTIILHQRDRDVASSHQVAEPRTTTPHKEGT